MPKMQTTAELLKERLRLHDAKSERLQPIYRELESVKNKIQQTIARQPGLRLGRQPGQTVFDDLATALADRGIDPRIRAELEHHKAQIEEIRCRLEPALDEFKTAQTLLEKMLASLVPAYETYLHQSINAVEEQIVNALKPFEEDENKARQLARDCSAHRACEWARSMFPPKTRGPAAQARNILSNAKFLEAA